MMMLICTWLRFLNYFIDNFCVCVNLCCFFVCFVYLFPFCVSLSSFVIKMYWLHIVGLVVFFSFLVYDNVDELWVPFERFGGILQWIHLASGFSLEDLALLFLYNWLLCVCLNCCSFNFVGHMCIKMDQFLMDWAGLGNTFSIYSLVILCISLEFIVISSLLFLVLLIWVLSPPLYFWLD